MQNTNLQKRWFKVIHDGTIQKLSWNVDGLVSSRYIIIRYSPNIFIVSRKLPKIHSQTPYRRKCGKILKIHKQVAAKRPNHPNEYHEESADC